MISRLGGQAVSPLGRHLLSLSLGSAPALFLEAARQHGSGIAVFDHWNRV
jgi:hypothetical protein